uniref:Uncharacterized protein n=1 Tax=Ackermannviridae sp. TaxID=2831612 RepID=A0A8S5VPN0_9CAUD|nr:MAG TPA: hypothetical protein [Ackermannviridae sp.]
MPLLCCASLCLCHAIQCRCSAKPCLCLAQLFRAMLMRG